MIDWGTSEEFRAPANAAPLPVRSLLPWGVEGQSVVALGVDAADRPDVADFLRVCRVDGPRGHAGADWTFVDDALILTFDCHAPARCQFDVALDLTRWEVRLAVHALATSEWVGVFIDDGRWDGALIVPVWEPPFLAAELAVRWPGLVFGRG